MGAVPSLRDILTAPSHAVAAVIDGALSAGAGSLRMDSAPPFPPFTAPRMDDARADGCSPCNLKSEGWGAGGAGPYRDYMRRPVLTRAPIDELFLRSLLMQRIVQLLPADMLRKAPELESASARPADDARVLPEVSSPTVDGAALWKAASGRGLPLALFDAMTYARKDGGGGVLVFLEDGLDPSEPVDLNRINRVRGYFALSRWELIAARWDTNTSPSWYGERFNRPSHYIAAPASGAAETVSGLWHRSRILPFAHVRLERRLSEYYSYNGWGPGVVEGIFTEFIARDGGARRMGDIIRSFGYDHLEIKNLQAMLSAADGSQRLRTILDNIRACRDLTGDGVGLIATGDGQEVKPLSRNVSNVDKLADVQREYLLDGLEYPAVVLYGRTQAGLGSGEARGEWQQYYGLVKNKCATWLWPRYRQALILEMAAKFGPTRGVIDMDIAAEWPSLWEVSDAERAEARERAAKARSLDVLNEVVSPDEARRDPQLAHDYPEVDFANTTASSQQGLVSRAGLEPRGRAGVEADETADDAGAVPLDLVTISRLCRELSIGRGGLRTLARTHGVKPYGGGNTTRYSKRAIVKAMLAHASPETKEQRDAP